MFVLKKILSFLSEPFGAHFNLFVIIFISISLDAITCYEDINYLLCFLSKSFVDSYVLTLIYTYLPYRIVKRFYILLIFSIVLLFFIIDVFAIFSFNRRFNIDVAYVVLGTNLKETVEFISEYVTLKLLVIVLIQVSALIVYFRFFYSKIRLSQSLSYIFILVLSFCFALCLRVNNPWNLSLFGKIYSLINISTVPDLKQYFTYPNLDVVSKRPHNIVIIFGESFSKEHSSLYGYEKNTNPYLTTLQKDSSLLVFTNVKSPALATVQSFKAMMSTFKYEYADSCQWYECTTIPELAKQASYSTYWISNQSEKGIFENIVSQYAYLCDTTVFVGDKFAGVLKKDYDENLINPIKKLSRDSLNLFCFHLMGSHPVFEERYPSEYNKFKESEYESHPMHQRHNLATYDNSVLYNDFVVNELINIFKDEESIIFYFSDHSLDIYNSSDDYCGHANANDSLSVKAGSNIPFVIYFSDKYRKEYPNIYFQFKQKITEPYYTEDFIYTLLEIMGCQFTNK